MVLNNFHHGTLQHFLYLDIGFYIENYTIVAPLVLLAISLFIALIAVVLFASIASSFLNSSFTNFIF